MTWLEICPLADLPPGTRKILFIENWNLEIGLLNVDGEIFCIEDSCPHQMLPFVKEGDIDTQAQEITCPHHQARFSLKTGDVKAPPAFCGLKTFPVKIQEQHIFIMLS